MPSILCGNQSGGVPALSGIDLYYSGQAVPVGGTQFHLDYTASGNIYIGFTSGGITVKSGGTGASGGLRDGYALGPGDTLFVPRTVFNLYSGNPPFYLSTDAAVSGQGRLYIQPF